MKAAVKCKLLLYADDSVESKWLPLGKNDVLLTSGLDKHCCSYMLIRLAPMWQQSGTLLFCSCHGIAGFLVDELQI